MTNPPLPNLPVPSPPADPACQWCGERPVEPYEVAPEVKGVDVRTDAAGNTTKRPVVKKRAVIAYACATHRETFDRRKRETEERKAREREERREAKAKGVPYRKPRAA